MIWRQMKQNEVKWSAQADSKTREVLLEKKISYPNIPL